MEGKVLEYSKKEFMDSLHLTTPLTLILTLQGKYYGSSFFC